MNRYRTTQATFWPVIVIGCMLAAACARPVAAQDDSVYIVPLITEDWHGGFDLEIGERGDPDSINIDNLPDSAVERIRAYMKMLDTRSMHSEYNLSTGTKAWAEFGTPEAVTDPATISRITTGLAHFDSASFPYHVDSASVPWLKQTFPTLTGEFEPALCGLTFHDLDGIAPPDLMLFVHSGGSAGCHTYHLALRTPHTVTFQDLDGCWRGMYNMLGRADDVNDSLFWFTSGYADSALVVEGRHVPYIMLNNNVWWPGSAGIMTEISDLPVPYFWDGEKMAWNPTLAWHFYAKLSGTLQYLSEADSATVAYAIETLFR